LIKGVNVELEGQEGQRPPDQKVGKEGGRFDALFPVWKKVVPFIGLWKSTHYNTTD